MSGQGYFAGYLNRFGLLPSAGCWFCSHPHDDALHTLFECDAWEVRRSQLEREIGVINPDNIVAKMLDNRQAWDACAAYITAVIKGKEAEERRHQAPKQL